MGTTSNLFAVRIAIDAAASAIRLVARLPVAYRPIGDQVVRAASSVALNLAEGEGHRGKSRQHHWRIAYGSAKETSAALELLLQVGCIDQAGAAKALDQLDHTRAITWKLMG